MAPKLDRADYAVIIPCRNARPFLGTLLSSLAGEDLRGAWEFIVIDNGSTDGSLSVAEQFLDRLPLRLVRTETVANASYARNVGVHESTAMYLFFLDADDDIAPGSLISEKTPHITLMCFGSLDPGLAFLLAVE